MDSTENPFTRRMLQRAASVRRNREGNLRFGREDSRRRISILQAIGDKQVKIADVADCRNDSGGTGPIGAENMFAGDKQRGLRRTNLTTSDSLISRRRARLDFCSQSRSNSSHPTGELKPDADCENVANFHRSSNEYADLRKSSADFGYTIANNGKERVNEKLPRDIKYLKNNAEILINENYFINKVMASVKNEEIPRRQNPESVANSKFKRSNEVYDKSKNGLDLTETFESTSLNITTGNSTNDTLTTSSYVKGFELGNVKWRGPLYNASVNSQKKKKKDEDFLERLFITQERLSSVDEPKLVKAIHTEIPTPQQIRTEVKTIGNCVEKPEAKSPPENESKNKKPGSLPLPISNSFEVEPRQNKRQRTFNTIPETPESPTTPLTDEIKRLDADIKCLSLHPRFNIPDNDEKLSPPDRIDPNLKFKVQSTPPAHIPKKLYRSPNSPEDTSVSPRPENPVEARWNFKSTNVSKKTTTSQTVVTAVIESDFVKANSKTERNYKFNPNMESTRESSLTDLSKNAEPSDRPPMSTVSLITIPPDTPESSGSAGTSSSPNDINVSVESAVPYNVDDFLADALGDELHNTTVTYPSSEVLDKSISQFNASELISEESTPLPKAKKGVSKKTPMTEPPPEHSSTINRTMTIYRSFTERIKNKLRPGLKVVPKLVPDDSTMTIDSVYDDKKIQELLQEANIQQTLMYQANKALNFCRLMKEFASSTEQVESERSLLVAGLRRAAALDEIKQLEYEFDSDASDVNICERGEVTIEDFSLPLKEDVLKYEAQTGDFVQWFVIAVSHRSTVWATKAVSCIQSPRIIFEGRFVFANLFPNFKLTVKIYSLKMRKITYNYDEKYHLNQAEKLSRCPSPKKLIMRKKTDRSLSPKEIKEIEFSAIRNTSFVLSGMVELYLHDLSLATPWPLTSLLPGSVLCGTVDLSISCKLHLTVSHSGFLTHGDEAGGFACWNRRWCNLEGQILKFWNYPCDQEDKEPLMVIDLTNCISVEITGVDRSLCAKPRTLLIETARKKSISDENSMFLECRSSCTIVKNLLCCDTAEDFSQWKSKLNRVVSSLRDWNATKRSPDLEISDL